MDDRIARAERLLAERFGHEDFLQGQREAVLAGLRGEDVLVVMPTGAGKSLCYQIPALCGDGYTLVVSPLIALMKDQVDGMAARGIAAATVHSGLLPEERGAVARRMQAGDLRVLLVAPERFRSERFVAFVQRLPPARFAVDEAHCISQWGHELAERREERFPMKMFDPDELRARLDKTGFEVLSTIAKTCLVQRHQEDWLEDPALRRRLLAAEEKVHGREAWVGLAGHLQMAARRR